MTTFLLLFSLILNAAAIFAIILLYLRQNRLAEAEKKQEKIIKEIEEVFTAYLFELKEENDKFLDLMEKTNSQNQRSVNKEVKNTKIVTDEWSEDAQQKLFQKGTTYHAARIAYKQSSNASLTDPEISGDVDIIQSDNPPLEKRALSLIDQVVFMKNKGLTIEEIARELDKGKTEIELLLKFRQNTQE